MTDPNPNPEDLAEDYQNPTSFSSSAAAERCTILQASVQSAQRYINSSETIGVKTAI